MQRLPHYQPPLPTRGVHSLQLINLRWYHCHPQSRVYIKARSWCCTFYGFGQMHNDTCPPRQCHTEQFHCPKTISIVLPFPESHVVGIIQYVAFLDWLISLRSMHLNFLSFHGLIAYILLALNNIPLCGCASLLIHSPTERHPGLPPGLGDYA